MAFVEPRQSRTFYLEEARKVRERPDHVRASGLRSILWWGLPTLDEPERLFGEDELFDIIYGDAGALYWRFSLSGSVPLIEFCDGLATHLADHIDRLPCFAESIRARLTLNAAAEPGPLLVREVPNGALPPMRFVHAGDAARWLWDRPLHRHLVPPSLACLWQEPARTVAASTRGRKPVVTERVTAALRAMPKAERAALTQSELANKLGCEQSTISKCLNRLK